MKRKEITIVLIIGIIAMVGLIITNRIGNSSEEDSGSGVVVAIQYRNAIIQEFDPYVDAVYTVTGDYGTLDVEVVDGKWRVTNEECPNHICASMGWAGVDDLMPITCLPNNIMIYVEEKPEE